MKKKVPPEKRPIKSQAQDSVASDQLTAKPSNRQIKALQGASTFQDLPDCARVRQPVVELLHGISSATLWRRVKSGHLPKPQLNGRVASWSVGEIRASLLEVK